MTQASGLISKLTNPINADRVTLDLLNAYISSEIVQDVKSMALERSAIVSEYDEADKQNALTSKLADKCFAYLSRGVNDQLSLSKILLSTMQDFEQQLSKAKVAMELNYSINQIELLTDSKARKIVLKDVVPFHQLQMRLTAIRYTVGALKDIRALMSEKVDEKVSSTLLEDTVYSYWNSDPALQKCLNDYLLDPTSLDTCTKRIEHIRPVMSSQAALTAGYNNLNCQAVFKLFGRLSQDLHDFSEHWFAGPFSLSTQNQSRYARCCQDLLNTDSGNDTVSRFVAMDCRLDWLRTASELIIGVVYPVVLKEITEFSVILETLGQHRHLDERAIDAEQVSLYASGYEAFQQIGEDVKYLQFAQNKNPKRHTHYVPNAMSYLSRRLEGLNQHIEQVVAGFNRVDTKVRRARKEVKLYHIDQMKQYAIRWTALIKDYTDWLYSLSSMTSAMDGWESYLPDTSQYLNLLSEINRSLPQLDLVETKNDSTLVATSTFSSALRDGYNRAIKIPVEMLEWNDHKKQQELALELHRCHDTCLELTKQVKLLNRMYHEFKDTGVQPSQTALVVIYNTVNTLLQWSNWIQHDFALIAENYSVE